MRNVTEIKDGVLSFLKKNILFVMIGIVGVVLLCLSFQPTKDSDTTKDTEDFCEEYVKNLENRLSDIVCDIAGVKDCKIMITLKSGIEYIYATDESANTDVNETGGDKKEQSEEKITIVSDKQIGEKAVVVKEHYPEISGVAIICNVANSPSLTLTLKSAAATALGIDAGKVCVVLRG